MPLFLSQHEACAHPHHELPPHWPFLHVRHSKHTKSQNCRTQSNVFVQNPEAHRRLPILPSSAGSMSSTIKSNPREPLQCVVNCNAEAGTHANKDAIVNLMLKDAMWLAEAAKRDVNVQPWMRFAETRALDVSGDIEMDEFQY